MEAEMMTLDEIQVATINPDVAREAHAQAQKRLEDALSTKASHEQKAFALLAAYITAALALFTVFGVLAAGTNHMLAPAFMLTGVVYVAGAILSGVALLPRTYGAIGSDPSAWLRTGIIDGGEAALSSALAYETFFQKKRIDDSIKSNNSKAKLIRVSIVAGAVAPLILVWWVWMGA
jgi:hypothetical protein